MSALENEINRSLSNGFWGVWFCQNRMLGDSVLTALEKMKQTDQQQHSDKLSILITTCLIHHQMELELSIEYHSLSRELKDKWLAAGVLCHDLETKQAYRTVCSEVGHGSW